MNSKVRAIAFHLPQYHPIPENDEWWGKGFTEWTNTAKAVPLFPGHYQPHVPADLGFYDLRMPEAREAQAAMAREYGIEAFCYYHYWFGNGRRLLEKPVDEIIRLGQPDFPFCLCWANESWTGIWHGSPRKMLVEQTYPGPDDEASHFRHLLAAFRDPRYVRVDGKPLFLVYNPKGLLDPIAFTQHWRQLATKAGLPGIYFVGHDNEPWRPADHGFDGATPRVLHLFRHNEASSLIPRIKQNIRKVRGQPPRLHSYADVLPQLNLPECNKPNVYPAAVPNWDNTARSGLRGLVLHESTPELFRQHFRSVLAQTSSKLPDQKLVFIKSWNEWAEGNHLEPDLKFGRRYLEVVRDELHAFDRSNVERFHSVLPPLRATP